ncbi:hypothetical protein BH11MYX4_BH11MYX4_30060 [soil metagenome]
MRFSAAWRGVVAVVLGGGAVACGLSAVASGSFDTGDDDASVAPREDAVASEAGADAADAQPDADAGCVPIIVDDALTTISTLRWLTVSSQADYPKAKDPGTGTTMVAINASMQPSQHAALWLRDPVPTTAFDVTFDYLLACESGQYCADGIAAAWLDTGDAGALANANPGKELGIPKLGGGAAAIKLDVKLSAPNTAEDTFPTLIVHAMDAGTSDGTPTKMLRADALVGELRRITLRLRKGQLTVVSSNDAGAAISVVGPTRSGFVGYFGLAASTGLHYDAAYVGSFHGEFYACEP